MAFDEHLCASPGEGAIGLPRRTKRLRAIANDASGPLGKAKTSPEAMHRRDVAGWNGHFGDGRNERRETRPRDNPPSIASTGSLHTAFVSPDRHSLLLTRKSLRVVTGSYTAVSAALRVAGRAAVSRLRHAGPNV